SEHACKGQNKVIELLELFSLPVPCIEWAISTSTPEAVSQPPQANFLYGRFAIACSTLEYSRHSISATPPRVSVTLNTIRQTLSARKAPDECQPIQPSQNTVKDRGSSDQYREPPPSLLQRQRQLSELLPAHQSALS